MKHLHLVGSLMLYPLCTLAQNTSSAPAPAAPDASPAKPHHLVFHPTATGGDAGVEAIQVGGGSRGGENLGVTLMTLVPEKNVALTTEAQPSLYWYQSKATEAQCEVTLTQPHVPKPLLMLKTSKTTPPGIHAIRLSKFNVELKPNVVYTWSVAVVVDPASRSGDIYARGVIKRIEPSPELAAKLAAPGADKAAVFAENGIWYDALQSISDQIDQSPADKSLREERAGLIDEVGLKGADMESSTPSVAPSKLP